MKQRLYMIGFWSISIIALSSCIEAKTKRDQLHSIRTEKKAKLPKQPLKHPADFSRVTIEDVDKSLILDELDYPTIDSIQRLAEAYWPTLAPVFVQQEQGGSFTGKLFSVSHMTQGQLQKVFFMKISIKRARNTWKHLKQIQESRIGAFCGFKNNHTPIITSVEKFFIYRDEENVEHTIEVLHAAKGTSAYEILQKKCTCNRKNTMCRGHWRSSGDISSRIYTLQ